MSCCWELPSRTKRNGACQKAYTLCIAYLHGHLSLESLLLICGDSFPSLWWNSTLVCPAFRKRWLWELGEGVQISSSVTFFLKGIKVEKRKSKWSPYALVFFCLGSGFSVFIERIGLGRYMFSGHPVVSVTD